MKVNTENLVGTRWRHKVRGLCYRIISDTACLQCATAVEFEEKFEGEHWIVYQSEVTGHVWVRPREEFLDGRFEQIEQAATPTSIEERIANQASTLSGVRKALMPFSDFADPHRKVPSALAITNGSPMAKRQLTMGDCYLARDAVTDAGVA